MELLGLPPCLGQLRLGVTPLRLPVGEKMLRQHQPSGERGRRSQARFAAQQFGVALQVGEKLAEVGALGEIKSHRRRQGGLRLWCGLVWRLCWRRDCHRAVAVAAVALQALQKLGFRRVVKLRWIDQQRLIGPAPAQRQHPRADPLPVVQQCGDVRSGLLRQGCRQGCGRIRVGEKKRSVFG